MTDVALQPIDDVDLDALFEQMRDPEAVHMAAFTPKGPDDREAFDAPEGISCASASPGQRPSSGRFARRACGDQLAVGPEELAGRERGPRQADLR